MTGKKTTAGLTWTPFQTFFYAHLKLKRTLSQQKNRFTTH